MLAYYRKLLFTHLQKRFRFGKFSKKFLIRKKEKKLSAIKFRQLNWKNSFLKFCQIMMKTEFIQAILKKLFNGIIFWLKTESTILQKLQKKKHQEKKNNLFITYLNINEHIRQMFCCVFYYG